MSIKFGKPRFIAAIGSIAVTAFLTWRSHVWEVESLKFTGMRGFAPEADFMVALHAPLVLAWQLTPPLYGTTMDLYGIPLILLSDALWSWVGRTWEHWRHGSEILHFSSLPARTGTNVLFLVLALITLLFGIREVEKRFQSDSRVAMAILEGGLYLAWSVGLLAIAMRDLRRSFVRKSRVPGGSTGATECQ